MVQSTFQAQGSDAEVPQDGAGDRAFPRPENFDRIGGYADRFHVAIIMDGNGRWAEERGEHRAAGHLAGATSVRRVVEAAPGLGITTLTLYAFSSDNWRRPVGEVNHLMRLFERHLDGECERLEETGVRLSVIGRRDRLSDVLLEKIEEVEARTVDGEALHLRLAIDYSARDAIWNAAARMIGEEYETRQAFERCLSQVMHAPHGSRDVDLLVRTGREQRLSDFMLWEAAYAELVFTDVLWPDFDEAHLTRAVETFGVRERRYGGLPEQERRAAS